MLGGIPKSPSAWDDKEVQKWFDRLTRGIKRRKVEQKIWLENEKFENLEQWGTDVVAPGDRPMINKVGSFIKSRLAAIAYKNPRFVVKPINDANWQAIPIPITDPNKGPMVDEQGQPMMKPVFKHTVCEHLMNFVVSQPSFGFNATIRRFIKAGYIGYGVLKTGYSPYFEDVPKDKKNEQLIPVGEDGLPDFSGFQKDEFGNLVEDEDGRYIETSPGPVREKWFIDWVPYRQMIIDPDGENDYYKHDWVAYEYERPLKEVKKDRRFKNTKDLSATGLRVDEDDKKYREAYEKEQLDPTLKDEREMVRLFEIFHFKTNRMIVLADSHGKKLYDEPVSRGIYHDPYSFLRFQEILGEFYQRPPVSDGAPINDEYNKYRQQQLISMRKATRKLLLKKGVADDRAKESLQSPTDLDIAEFDMAEGIPFESVLRYLDPPNLSGDVFAYGKNIAMDFDEVMGQPPEARGQPGSNTATQVNNLQMHETMRQDDDRNMLAEALRDVGKKLLDSLQANMTMPMAVAIEGEDGQVFQTMVDRNMIVGDFDVSVDITEMMPKNPGDMQARYVQLLQVAGQAPWLFMQETTAAPIFEAFGVTDRRFIEGVTQGAQMQMMMLAAPAQPEKPDRKPPKDEAQKESQDRGAKASGRS